MPGSTLQLPDSDVLDEVRSRASTALGNAGWPDTDVYSVQAPREEDLPLATASIDDETESAMAKDKDTSPVAIFPAVRLWALDHQLVEDGANEVAQEITSNASPFSITGWTVHVVTLNSATPNHAQRTDAPTLYGKSLQFEIHLEPTP